MQESLLKTLRLPQDITTLDVKQLQTLSAEVRERIIDVLSSKGGHLASNLGTVELTVALHKVFNSPSDKFIFDVSHQTYSHKILTGREESFESILKLGGLSGFGDPNESEHDHFLAGHAGTALSLGLGLLHNRNLDKRDDFVIPVIGDASLTCGLTLEALNNIPNDAKKFMVILNDNAMSISKNVGAITQILSRLINNPTSTRLFADLEKIASRIPKAGEMLARHGKKVRESLKNLVSCATFFEQFGLSYIGPIDGHDMKGLVDTFNRIKELEKPVLVHVVTKKGLGLTEAMENPVSHHGAKPFDKSTGKFLPAKNPSPPTFPKVFGKQLVELGKQDPKVAVITPAMSYGSSLDPFMEAFPERSFDVGIAESHSVTFAGGLCYGKKLKVVMVIYATFLQRAFDNLFHDVCLQELPVVFALDRAGLAPYGPTHHGIYDISFLNVMPHMIIAQPRNGKVLKELMNSAFDWQRPTAIRYPNVMAEEEEGDLRKRTPGTAECISEGKEILLIPLGNMCSTALKAKEILAEKGIYPTILDPVFLKPLDTETLTHYLSTHHTVVTLEEHSVLGGLGMIISQFLAQHNHTHIKQLNLGIPDQFVQHGSLHELLDQLGLTPEKVAQSIEEYVLAEQVTITHP